MAKISAQASVSMGSSEHERAKSVREGFARCSRKSGGSLAMSPNHARLPECTLALVCHLVCLVCGRLWLHARQGGIISCLESLLTCTHILSLGHSMVALLICCERGVQSLFLNCVGITSRSRRHEASCPAAMSF